MKIKNLSYSDIITYGFICENCGLFVDRRNLPAIFHECGEVIDVTWKDIIDDPNYLLEDENNNAHSLAE